MGGLYGPRFRVPKITAFKAVRPFSGLNLITHQLTVHHLGKSRCQGLDQFGPINGAIYAFPQTGAVGAQPLTPHVFLFGLDAQPVNQALMRRTQQNRPVLQNSTPKASLGAADEFAPLPLYFGARNARKARKSRRSTAGARRARLSAL